MGHLFSMIWNKILAYDINFKHAYTKEYNFRYNFLFERKWFHRKYLPQIKMNVPYFEFEKYFLYLYKPIVM